MSGSSGPTAVYATSTHAAGHILGPLDAYSPASHALDTPSPGVDEGRTSPLHGVGSSASGGGAAHLDGKRTARERRVMPARLRRVSSLLTGSIIEEEIAGAAAKDAEIAAALPGNVSVLLTKDSINCKPIPYATAARASVALTGTLDRQIETPDYRTRDDSEVMGKTRSMRSEEDTSDAAYERRHRKADNAEKRLRRWEKENLRKDRQKIVERIEHLRATDVRTLAPILNVREQRQRQYAERSSPSMPAVSAATSAATSSEEDAVALQTKLEHLRDDLVEECKAILRRYDALLTVPVEEATVQQPAKRKKALDDEGELASSNASAAEDGELPTRPRRTISVSGAFARKTALPKVSTVKPTKQTASTAQKGSELRATVSTSNLSDMPTKKPNTKYVARDLKARRLSIERNPQPFTDKDGNLRAEHTYANIHARTSGGRFAPKVALGSIPGAAPSSRSKINTKTGRVKAAASGKLKKSASAPVLASTAAATDVPQKRRPGRPRKDERRGSASAAASTSRLTAAAASTLPPTRARGQRRVFSADPSLDGNDRNSARARRVTVVLSRNGKHAASSGGSSSSSVSTISTPSTEPARVDSEVAKEGEMLPDTDAEMDTALPNEVAASARSALTLEEAQALLAKAMAEGEDEDAVDAAAAAASMMVPRIQ